MYVCAGMHVCTGMSACTFVQSERSVNVINLFFYCFFNLSYSSIPFLTFFPRRNDAQKRYTSAEQKLKEIKEKSGSEVKFKKLYRNVRFIYKIPFFQFTIFHLLFKGEQ